MNFFAHRSAAERYAQSRPYFHPLAVERIVERTGRVGAVLDVACGTGMGARALLAMADSVTGCDLAPEMLEFARRDVPEVEFVHSSAEALPFPDASFGLVTTFLAFHWFDGPRFLAEARRVLEPGGWLVICNHFFTAKLVGHPEFQGFKENFYPHFPNPPRGANSPDPETVAAHGFALEEHQDFAHTVPMNAHELALYISSQSNIIARVESGEVALEAVLEEIRSAVTPMLGSARGEFQFAGSLWFLRRAQDDHSS